MQLISFSPLKHLLVAASLAPLAAIGGELLNNVTNPGASWPPAYSLN